jgi:hypothetical protein
MPFSVQAVGQVPVQQLLEPPSDFIMKPLCNARTLSTPVHSPIQSQEIV